METTMSMLDRILGNRPTPRDDSQPRATPLSSGSAEDTPSAGRPNDEQAVERYRYLLRTAPPQTIEQAHAEAFSQLTPEQRHLVLEQLSKELPAQERTDREDPQSLARMATRAELRRPGTLERSFGGQNPGGAGIGLGTFLAYDLFSTIAGVVIGTAIANAVFNEDGNDQGSADDSEAARDDQGTSESDAGYDDGDSGYDGDGGFGADFGEGEF
jgi:hypothetical protein